MKLFKRLLKKSLISTFIFGPRGTGKTSWARDSYPDAPYLDLLDSGTKRQYLHRPELLRDFVDGRPDQKMIIIDEVQNVPEILNMVHWLIENRKGTHFIMTGSSTRKLRRGRANFLGGRAIIKTMHPFMACELADVFHLDQALKLGMLPIVWAAPEKQRHLRLRSHIETYIREEVETEGWVRDLGAFSRCLECMSFSQGAALNLKSISREAHVGYDAALGYLKILNDLLISFDLPVFTRKASRELTSKPKFYYFDVGLYHSIRPFGPLDSQSEIQGVALETLVAQHLRAWCEYSDNQHKLYYWRTKSGVEVDFIIYGPLGLWAIEVKNSMRMRDEYLRSLASFKKDYPQAKCILLYRGKEHLLKKGYIQCLPVDTFLRKLVPNEVVCE